MFRFVHAADIHLDSPLRGLGRREDDASAERIRLASRRALENLVQLCLDEEAAFLVIAGDLYDGDWPDYNTGLFFVRQMERLDRARVPVFLLYGNHDAQSHMTRSLRLPPNVRVFDDRAPMSFELEEPRVVLHGQSFARRAVFDDLSAGYGAPAADAFNVGVLHTSLTGAEGHEPYAPCNPDALAARGYQYWALGHVHAGAVVRDDPWIVFPGNLQGRHVRECGAKGARLVTVRDDRVVSAEHRVLDVVRWATLVIEIGPSDGPEEAITQVADALDAACDEADGRLLAVRIAVTGRTSESDRITREVDALGAECRAAALRCKSEVWIESVRVHTRAPRVAEAADGDDPCAAVVRSLLDGDEIVDPDLLATPELESKIRKRFGIEDGEAGAILAEARELLLAELAPERVPR